MSEHIWPPLYYAVAKTQVQSAAAGQHLLIFCRYPLLKLSGHTNSTLVFHFQSTTDFLYHYCTSGNLSKTSSFNFIQLKYFVYYRVYVPSYPFDPFQDLPYLLPDEEGKRIFFEAAKHFKVGVKDGIVKYKDIPLKTIVEGEFELRQHTLWGIKIQKKLQAITQL